METENKSQNESECKSQDPSNYSLKCPSCPNSHFGLDANYCSDCGSPLTHSVLMQPKNKPFSEEEYVAFAKEIYQNGGQQCEVEMPIYIAGMKRMWEIKNRFNPTVKSLSRGSNPIVLVDLFNKHSTHIETNNGIITPAMDLQEFTKAVNELGISAVAFHLPTEDNKKGDETK